MARIPLTSGFSLMPEGTYVFRIYEATYDDKFGKIVIKMVNAQGQTMQERFSLKSGKDTWNEGALNAFSYLARVATQDFESDDVDVNDLVDCYIRAEVVHTEGTSRTGKPTTYANLGNKESADGFDEEPCEKALTLGHDTKTITTSNTNESTDFDLDALLG